MSSPIKMTTINNQPAFNLRKAARSSIPRPFIAPKTRTENLEQIAETQLVVPNRLDVKSTEEQLSSCSIDDLHVSVATQGSNVEQTSLTSSNVDVSEQELVVDKEDNKYPNAVGRNKIIKKTNKTSSVLPNKLAFKTPKKPSVVEKTDNRNRKLVQKNSTLEPRQAVSDSHMSELERAQKRISELESCLNLQKSMYQTLADEHEQVRADADSYKQQLNDYHSLLERHGIDPIALQKIDDDATSRVAHQTEAVEMYSVLVDLLQSCKTGNMDVAQNMDLVISEIRSSAADHCDST